MIGRISGVILEKQPPYLLIDVNGVGYEIQAPMTTFYHLPNLGEKTTLHTHLVVREDAHLLYGFRELRDRALFRHLLKVNGVGPKLALAILSGMTAMEFTQCVANQSVSMLVRIPGVGKKTAERLLIEMRDRLIGQPVGPVLSSQSVSVTEIEVGDFTITSPIQDAIYALQSLGYKPQEAQRAIQRVQAPDLGCEELIKRALTTS